MGSQTEIAIPLLLSVARSLLWVPLGSFPWFHAEWLLRDQHHSQAHRAGRHDTRQRGPLVHPWRHHVDGGGWSGARQERRVSSITCSKALRNGPGTVAIPACRRARTSAEGSG